MSLVTVKNGRRVRFLAVETGHALKARLTAMGLIPGIGIEVLQNSPHGPFVIAVKGSRIMLGRGIASKIDVK